LTDATGGKPVRRRVAASRKRVLRGCRVTGAAKRRQRMSRPRGWTPKSRDAGADAVHGAEGDARAPKWPVRYHVHHLRHYFTASLRLEARFERMPITLDVVPIYFSRAGGARTPSRFSPVRSKAARKRPRAGTQPPTRQSVTRPHSFSRAGTPRPARSSSESSRPATGAARSSSCARRTASRPAQAAAPDVTFAAGQDPTRTRPAIP